jgi:hypothetical protein
MTSATITLDITQRGIWFRDQRVGDTLHNAIARLRSIGTPGDATIVLRSFGCIVRSSTFEYLSRNSKQPIPAIAAA